MGVSFSANPSGDDDEYVDKSSLGTQLKMLGVRLCPFPVGRRNQNEVINDLELSAPN